MQKIIPNIWFNRNAVEASEFYARVLPKATASVASHYPSEGLLDFQKDFAGAPLTLDLDVDGYRLVLLNAGPEFPVNPSISFTLAFDPRHFGGDSVRALAALEETWAGLSEGGQALMPLQEYPFSARYGWIMDRYGVTWQLRVPDPSGEARPFLVPSLMFAGSSQNLAKEAIETYTSLFPDSRVGVISEYPVATGPAPAGAVQYGDFQLAGQWFSAMHSGVEQPFSFTCGVSLMVNCADQAEIDRYWDALTAVPAAEVCGWLQDRFGLAWQIAPENMDELMEKPNAYATMMTMKKLVIADF